MVNIRNLAQTVGIIFRFGIDFQAFYFSTLFLMNEKVKTIGISIRDLNFFKKGRVHRFDCVVDFVHITYSKGSRRFFNKVDIVKRPMILFANGDIQTYLPRIEFAPQTMLLCSKQYKYFSIIILIYAVHFNGNIMKYGLLYGKINILRFI